MKRLEPCMNCSFLSHHNHFCSFEKSPTEFGKHGGQQKYKQENQLEGGCIISVTDDENGTGVEWKEK